MDVIKVARELGKELQKDPRYAAYHVAKDKNDNDEVLQNLIGEFNLKRMELNQEMQKPEKDNDKMTALDGEIKEIYGKIMTNESMVEYQNTKNEMDALLNKINFIITMAANGEDPETCPEEMPHSNCSGSCSTCGGCH